jgi:transcriptional regulator with XRE-family HTH domain
MTRPSKDLNPYLSARTFYGAELRRLRESTGFSQDALGQRVFCSGTYIGQFETAERRPQMDLSERLDEVLVSGEHMQRLCKLAHEAERHPEYFADVAAMEKLARAISEFSPILVPGLLQTAEYARAVTRATLPLAPDEEVEKHVTARLDRQKILMAENGPQVWEVIHESALRIPVGDRAVMCGQLKRIAEVIRARQAIVQVIPDAAGAHAFMMGMISCLSFADAPPIVYTESAHAGHIIDDPALVDRYHASYDVARAVALSPEASLAMIESAAKDYETP